MSKLAQGFRCMQVKLATTYPLLLPITNQCVSTCRDDSKPERAWHGNVHLDGKLQYEPYSASRRVRRFTVEQFRLRRPLRGPRPPPPGSKAIAISYNPWPYSFVQLSTPLPFTPSPLSSLEAYKDSLSTAWSRLLDSDSTYLFYLIFFITF